MLENVKKWKIEKWNTRIFLKNGTNGTLNNGKMEHVGTIEKKEN